MTVTKTRKIESTSTTDLSSKPMTLLRVRATRKKLLSVRPVQPSLPLFIKVSKKFHEKLPNNHEVFNGREKISIIASKAFAVTNINQFSNLPLTQNFYDPIVNRDIISTRQIHTDSKNNKTEIRPSKTFITNDESNIKDIEQKLLARYSNGHQIDPIMNTSYMINHTSTLCSVLGTDLSDSSECLEDTLSRVSMQSSNFKQNHISTTFHIASSLEINASYPNDALLKLSEATGYIHPTKTWEFAMTTASIFRNGNIISYNSNKLNSSQLLYRNNSGIKVENEMHSHSTFKLTENRITSTRLRTYTYVVTKINNVETEVTSSTTVRPYLNIITLTVPVTVFPITEEEDLINYSSAVITTQSNHHGYHLSQFMKHMEGVQEERERKMNLATRIMSNGVEVIIAGPTPAFRWENMDPQPTITLSDSVVMLMPTEDPNEFVTKTCTTTFTYLNTITKDGSLIISTDQQIVANTATEERRRNPGSDSSAITLDASPTLRTEIFKTTYTYLTLNAEYPDKNNALGSSQKVITNTVTVPQHYLDMLLEPSQLLLPRTNTYISTRKHKKTYVNNSLSKIETRYDTITQLIITDLATTSPRITSVTTTLTALDYAEDSLDADVLEPYYITHTYYDAYHEHSNNITIRPNIAVSTGAATEYASAMTSNINSQVFSAADTSATSVSKAHKVEILSTESVKGNSLTNKCIDPLTATQHSLSVTNIVTGSTIIFFDEDDRVEGSSLMTQVLSTVPKNHFGSENEDKNEPNKDSGSSVSFEITNSTTPLIQEVSSDEISQSSTDQPVESLLNLGSLGISSLSALGPVITAMAGLLQKNTLINRRNDSTAVHPPLDLIRMNNVTTERSPIYIPVAEYIKKDIEAAESQNVPEQIVIPDSKHDKHHKISNNLVNGIPISPGEIITANSDVIVGKPGKLGPSPPQSHQLRENVKLKIPSISVPQILAYPMLDVFKTKNATGHASFIFDGTPAKPEVTLHDPLLKPPSRPNIEKYANPNFDSNELDKFPNRYQRPWASSQTVSTSLILPTAYQFHGDDYTSQQSSEPILNKDNGQRILKDHYGNFSNYSISESRLPSTKMSKPIVQQVPHVIDRSTGQPLLVNIQPSQIANVVIPQGGLQALVFGDTNEPHISGQYFDDPLPYSKSQRFQSSNTIVTLNSTAYPTMTHPYDLVEIQTDFDKQKRPLQMPAIHYPHIYNRSIHGQVHTQILVHQASDTVNTIMPKSEETPFQSTNVHQKYYQHNVKEHLAGQTSTAIPMQNIHQNYRYSSTNMTETTLSHDNSEHQWKNNRNSTRLHDNSWLIPTDNPKEQIYTAYDDLESLGSAEIERTYVRRIFSSTQTPKSSNTLSRISIDESQDNVQPNFNHIVNYSVDPYVEIQRQDPPISIDNIDFNLVNVPQRFPQIQTVSGISSADDQQTWFNIHTELNPSSYNSQAEKSDQKIDYDNQVHENKNQKHSNFGSFPFIYPFLNQKKKTETKTIDASVNRKNIDQIGTKPVINNLTENLESIKKYRHPFDTMENAVLKNKEAGDELLKQKSRISSVYILPFRTNFQDPKGIESIDATKLNLLEIIPYSTKSQIDPSALTNSQFPYVPTSSHSRQELDWISNQRYESITSSEIPIRFHKVNEKKSINQIPSQLILNTYESPMNIMKKDELEHTDNNDERFIVSGSDSIHSPFKLKSEPIQLSALHTLVPHSEFHKSVNNHDQKHDLLDYIKPFIGEQRPMIIHAKDNELSRKTSTHVDFVTAVYDRNLLSNVYMNSRTHMKIPSPGIKPRPVTSGSKANYLISENKGMGIPITPVSGNVIGMTPPPPEILRINTNLSDNQRSGLKSALKLFRPNSSKKYSGKNRLATSSPQRIALELPIALITRSEIVNRPSQKMVPPPLPLRSLLPTFLSAPPERVNLRPAIAVSGSIQIATEVAKSNIPLIQDYESSIPIVHGTVDFPVSADVIQFEGSKEPQEQNYINKLTSRVFESKYPSAAPVSITHLSPAIVLMNSKPAHIINTSSTMHLVIHPVQSIKTDSLRASRNTSHSVVILETSYNRLSQTISRIKPTKSVIYHDILKDVTETSMNVNSNSFIIDNRFRKLASDVSNLIVPNTTMHYELSSIPIDDILKIDTTKLIVPTITKIEIEPKEVTRFKTLTITMTETSVVGSPPTTRTVLLTHTITSTIVETVTETLLRPTNVLATITSVTTVTLQSATWLQSHKIKPTDTMDSIFIVMSDRNLPAASAESVEAEYGSEEEIFSRDEQDVDGTEFHKEILDNGLVASLRHYRTSTTKCLPDCIPYKSEICMQVNDDSNNIQARCVCRPGFARMFTDRPCKPTYTYTLHISLERIGHRSLAYDHIYNRSNTWVSRKFDVIKEALDRTLMQSDLRDIYQNLNIVAFHRNFTSVEFNVQFTENTNEMKLREVITKYLTANNCSLGGTEVFASPDFENIDAQDFNECMTKNGGPYNDCSPQAVCFNRRGYYECLCKKGWTDISENPLYPGRQCSQALTGCSRCNYKGQCMNNSYGQSICECSPWYTGQHCQVNLKVLLILLVIAALILLSVLVIFLVITCFKSTDKKGKCADRREIITSGNAEEDSFSEENITAIPNHVPHILPIPQNLQIPLFGNSVKYPKKFTKSHKLPKKIDTTILLPKKTSQDSKSNGLNVMIPRAKYRMGAQPSQQYTIEQIPIANFSADETKLLRSMENGSPEHCGSSQVSITNGYDKNCDNSDCRTDRNTLKNGALVSAGFQVSATVTKDVNANYTTVEKVEALTKKRYQDSSDSTDSTSLITRTWNPSTVQIKTSLLPFDIVKKNLNIGHTSSNFMSNEQRTINHSFTENRDAEDSINEDLIGSTLRLQHIPSYNVI